MSLDSVAVDPRASASVEGRKKDNEIWMQTASSCRRGLISSLKNEKKHLKWKKN